MRNLPMNRSIYCILALIFIFQQSYAQQKFTISGSVRDSISGEDLIGATLTIKELPDKGAITNAYGFYSLTLPAGTYTLTLRYIGYEHQIIKIELFQNIRQNYELKETIKELQEVIVADKRSDENVTNIQTSLQKLDTKEIRNVPVIMGERDVLKTIQLLPGIKSAGEGGSGFNVRGGASDQNLILLDEATVYNASHLMGFFSIFNSDAIKDISVFKGNEPAEYGGRLSSVLDVKMNDGSDKNYGVSGGIGLIASRLNVEGPIIKNRSSFIISARRTYADVFTMFSRNSDIKNTSLFFYDLNVKTNYRINQKNRVFLSGYFGRDVFDFANAFGMDWGNSTGTLRLNHLFTDRLFSNTSIIFSNYDYKINITSGEEFNIISRIQDFSFKQDFQYFTGISTSLKFGFNSMYHKIIPGVITAGNNTNVRDLLNKYSWDNAFYISGQTKIFENVSIGYGMRLSLFSLTGPGDFYSYDTEGNITDTSRYKSGEFVKTYFNPEPRVSLNISVTSRSSVKAAYARNVQNLHLLSNSTSGSPTDLWIPSSLNVKPEIADQVSLGYYQNFNDNQYELSAEIYYKSLQNQIDYINGAELNFNENVESQILFGTGRAYGLELFLKKRTGKFTGWIGYTLSRTERKFDGINNGNYFPARQDRTHDVSIVGMYELGKRWNLSATWVFYTGNAVTFPCGKYEVDGFTRFYYTDRNASRMPDYHRLDLSATWTKRKKIKSESSWSFSLYNAYGQENAYMITFRESKSDPSRTEAVQLTLFRFIPSVSYNFKF